MRCKISVWCTPAEKTAIAARAKAANLPASEYLRKYGLKGQIRTGKTLSPELLAFSGLLLQIAAPLHQIARRLDNNQSLSPTELQTLKDLSLQYKQMADTLRSHIDNSS